MDKNRKKELLWQIERVEKGERECNASIEQREASHDECS